MVAVCAISAASFVLFCAQAVLRVMLRGPDELERSGASHLLAAFCQDNSLGQMAVLSTVAYAGGAGALRV